MQQTGQSRPSVLQTRTTMESIDTVPGTAYQHNRASISKRRTIVVKQQRKGLNKDIHQIERAVTQFYEEMTNEQFEQELMSDSNLDRVTFGLFDKKMKELGMTNKLAGELCIHLYEKHQRDYDLDKIEQLLHNMDKSLFVQFRDAKITLNQLKARVAERRGLAKYKCFEDVYPHLNKEE